MGQDRDLQRHRQTTRQEETGAAAVVMGSTALVATAGWEAAGWEEEAKVGWEAATAEQARAGTAAWEAAAAVGWEGKEVQEEMGLGAATAGAKLEAAAEAAASPMEAAGLTGVEGSARTP